MCAGYKIRHTQAFKQSIVDTTTTPNEVASFVDIKDNLYALKLNKNLKRKKIHQYISDVSNYVNSKLYKKDNFNDMKKKLEETSNIIGKCNRGEYLNEFSKIRPIKFRENFGDNDFNSPLDDNVWQNYYEGGGEAGTKVLKKIYF